MMIILAAIIGAFAWRGRGGWIHLPSTQLARLVGVLPLAAIMLVLQGWQLALCAAAGLIVVTIGWAKWQEMTSPTDFIMMTLRGLLQVIPTCIGLWYFGHAQAAGEYLAAGACMGAIYALAWRIVPTSTRIKLFGNYLVDGPCAAAEMMFGACLYGGLVAVL